ncbi:MAG: CHAT domain-containing protein [Cyanobacteria bacterium P01_A01_bin.114]
MNRAATKFVKIALLVTFATLIFGFGTAHLKAHSQSPQPSETFLVPFADQCRQRQQLSSAEQHTVEQLLDIADAADCQATHDFLLTQTSLELQDRQIVSLQPLAQFPQLETLYLDNNQIADLKPLTSLTQLSELYLLGNQIIDLSPLAQLSNLKTLYLDNNNIQELEPLSGLENLTILYANSNRIGTLIPLSNLPNLAQLYASDNQIEEIPRLSPDLTHLTLSYNRITAVSSLTASTQLTELSLNNNHITHLNALAPLRQLISLDVRNNPLASKTCPIFPASVCLFSDDAADLSRLADQQRQQEDLMTALETYRNALEIYQQNGDRLRESNTLDRIGNLYDELGQYANALAQYQQAADIRQTVGDRQGEIETLTHLGITYIRLGQTEKALTFLQTALALQPNLARRDRPEPQTGKILNGLALAYSRLEKPAEALRYAKQSLAHARRVNDRPGEATALNRVGEAYLQTGNLDKARLYLDKAAALSQAQNDLPSLARSLHNQGDLALHQNNPTAALAQYQQAQQLWQDLGEDGAAGAGDTLNAIGALYLQTGQPAEAVTTLQATVAFWERLRLGLTDADKISIAETQTQTYQLLQQALIEQHQPETALEVSESGRARAFAELLAHRLTLQGKPLPPAQLQSPTVSQIQAIARAQKATLVEYSLMPTELYIWVVEPTGTVHFRRQPLTVRSLPENVRDSRIALGVRGRGARFGGGFATSLPARPPQETGRQLYQMLIQPIADLLPAQTPVIIIPQGELFLVPFPALQAETGTALIEQHPLLFAPAIGLLRSTEPAQAPLLIGDAPALVVGNPVMPLDPDTGSPLQPLSGAQQEALTIAPLLNTQPLIGETATKAAVVSQIEEAKIAHFATHGLLDDFGTGIPGALALTPTANDAGFLTAAEIFDLSLTARMVVLSACNTGQGKITGDGVVGLSRSFLTAGVESVVVSLWAVPDDATALLMAEFYRQLQHQPNRAIALQQAMLTTRARYSQPSNWAAFALFGEMGEPQQRAE